MPENSLPTAVPTRQAIEAKDRSQRMRVTGKLKVAIEAMIWEGVPRADAAAKAGMADSSLRFALRKPHVLAHHNAELASLRTSLPATSTASTTSATRAATTWPACRPSRRSSR
jgi:hypothetical protein